jgi:hypothetical protein
MEIELYIMWCNTSDEHYDTHDKGHEKHTKENEVMWLLNTTFRLSSFVLYTNQHHDWMT